MAAFTFAVIGHNEVARLHCALGQAHEAAQPGDSVWFIDSASDDGSAERAAGLGAEVVAAPIGKGRAIAAALGACQTEFIVFVDGDMEASDCNVFAALRDAVVATTADMVVADFVEPNRPRRLVTPYVYRPLMEALFPELGASDVITPLSGQRALRASFSVGLIPPEYGVETHLNLHVGRRGTVATLPIGKFVGPVRPNSVAVASDAAWSILEAAERDGRLAAAQRPEWDAWVQCVLNALSAARSAPEGDVLPFYERVQAAAARPMPRRLTYGVKP